MELIRLSALGLSVAALLVLLLAFISWRLRLGVEKRLLIAALRSVIQLLLLGMVLKTLFSQADLLYIWPSPILIPRLG